MAGPVARTYKSGSIIYFEGDRGDDVYVLQKGRIVLISQSLDLKDEIKEDVRKGEFFGVKSSLGRYPREETAQVLVDSLVLVFTPTQFEELSLKNTRLVIQMLKVFSAQLRKVHNKVRELLGEKSQDENSIELMKVAEYYYKNNELDHALHAYEAFIRQFPNSGLKPRATQMSQNIKKGAQYPLDARPLEEDIAATRPQNSFQPEFNAYGTDSIPAGDIDDFAPPPMDDLHGGLDGMSDMKDAAAYYYEGVNLFSQGDYDGALSNFKSVLEQRQLTPDQAKIPEQAEYEIARCHGKKEEWQTALEAYSHFIKKYPRSDKQKKALIAVAEIYEKKKDLQRAMGLYQKVAAMTPHDKDTNLAAEKLKRLSGK